MAEAVIKRLPKVSLHDHLDGGVRPQTIIELADEAGLAVPFENGIEFGSWIAEQSNTGSLSEYLKPFYYTGAVMQSHENLRRIAREAVEELAADGVVYGELRWAPENHQRRGLSLDEAVEAVQEGIDEGVAEACRSGREIRIGQLITAMRHGSRSPEVAELATRHKTQGVVGFDIAGIEQGNPPSRHTAAFDHLAEALIPVTVHAGEGDGLESIRSALFHGRALRLGHGVRLAQDITPCASSVSGFKLGELAQWVKDRQIALEISPSSNVQTGAISPWGAQLEDHPIDVLYNLGFRVTVNTDNRLMSGTTLTNELNQLMEAFNYGIEDLLAFQLNAASAAFLPLDAREELKEKIRTEFQGHQVSCSQVSPN